MVWIFLYLGLIIEKCVILFHLIAMIDDLNLTIFKEVKSKGYEATVIGDFDFSRY